MSHHSRKRSKSSASLSKLSDCKTPKLKTADPVYAMSAGAACSGVYRG